MGCEDFDLYLRNKIFPKGIAQEHSKKNIFNFPYFWPTSPIFGAKIVFPQNQVVMHNFLKVSGTMPKFREI